MMIFLFKPILSIIKNKHTIFFKIFNKGKLNLKRKRK